MTFVCAWLIALPSARAEAPTAADLLQKMKIALGDDTDRFARLTIAAAAAPAGPAARFYFFSSDAQHAALLVQTAPEDARGFAFLEREGRLEGFNPFCRCSAEADPETMVKRFGLALSDLDPRRLAGLKPLGEARAEFLDGRAVFTLELAAGAGTVVLHLSGETLLPVRSTRRDASGAAARTVDYLSYAGIGRRRFARRLAVRDSSGPALLVEADRQSAAPLPDFIFTGAYLAETVGRP